AVDPVRGAVMRWIGLRGRDLVTAAPRSTQPQLAHQPLDGAAGCGDALAVQGDPDLAGSADAEVRRMDPLDLAFEPLVALLAAGDAALLAHPVGRLGDRCPVLGQHATDRLDSEAVSILVDEGADQRCGRSSSAAKKAEAAFKISRSEEHTSELQSRENLVCR